MRLNRSLDVHHLPSSSTTRLDRGPGETAPLRPSPRQPGHQHGNEPMCRIGDLWLGNLALGRGFGGGAHLKDANLALSFAGAFSLQAARGGAFRLAISMATSKPTWSGARRPRNRYFAATLDSRASNGPQVSSSWSHLYRGERIRPSRRRLVAGQWGIDGRHVPQDRDFNDNVRALVSHVVRRTRRTSADGLGEPMASHRYQDRSPAAGRAPCPVAHGPKEPLSERAGHRTASVAHRHSHRHRYGLPYPIRRPRGGIHGRTTGLEER